MIDDESRAAPRFPERSVEAAAATLKARLESSGVRIGYGSAASLFMVPVLAVVVWVQVRYLQRQDER